MIRIPHEVCYPGHVRPYTRATALSSGWVWDIVQTTCLSLGYARSSAFIDLDAAERELRAYEGPLADGFAPSTIHFKVGMRERVARSSTSSTCTTA